MQGKDTKIALVGYKLADGGQERVFSTVSELLHDANCQVHVIVLEDKINYPSFGTLVNFGIYNKFQKYLELRKYLKKHNFDYIIDFRYRINPLMELLFVHYIYSGLKFIYTIHSSKLVIYFTKNKFVINQILQKAYKIVAVSTAMNEIIKQEYQFKKTVVIPNSIPKMKVQIQDSESKFQFKYCIAIGRLVKLKQFDKLIKTYYESDLPNKKIHLVILGEGEEKKRLQSLIEQFQMAQFIHVLGFVENIDNYIQHAEFLILTSEYEGFPMVILEALNLGTPVISFDCETGPSEMIVNKKNGLLVKNQDFETLKTAMNEMAENTALHQLCKENTQSSVVSFSAENIQKKWIKVLNIE